MTEIKTIEALIQDLDHYDAHVRKNEQNEVIKRESLSQHIKLTIKYFRNLWEKKNMSHMVDRFCDQICKGMESDTKEFLIETIFGIPLFHDIGKINPEFQNKTMENNRLREKSVFTSIGSRHSMISSIIYLDYYLTRLKESVKDRDVRKKLRLFLVLHAYIIERHHSNICKFSKYLESLEEGQGSEVIRILKNGACAAYQKDVSLEKKEIVSLIRDIGKQLDKDFSEEGHIGLYAYVKLWYSLLVASDYYATAEFMSGTQIDQFGELEQVEKWINIYENTELMKKIRVYEQERYPQNANVLRMDKDINHLRTELLLDAERALEDCKQETLFYLEAPTGSGKSNVAVDLALRMMREDKQLKKIYYIYPFNTLVEQNIKMLQKVFGGEEEIFKEIAVVNSLTPIKSVEEDSEQTMDYQKALLDRQFLNYPMIVSTHVSLFDTMFGDTKESAFGFYQLMNSVIVLDEIQSYKNTLWGEMIHFLKEFSHLLHIKILIMSATLPNLDLLSEYAYPAAMLMKDKEKYFFHSCFKERVQISYELLEEEDAEEPLLNHIKKSALKEKKILVEFIKKDTAYRFFERLLEEPDVACDVEYMSGDDSVVERSRILNKIKKEQRAIILVATQVIEAGVDIDMDIGYKNISKLDSEEQFLGRINRSCLRKGNVYFFKIDEGKKIYEGDIRIEKEFTLENEEMRGLLHHKRFYEYYEKVLKVLKKNYNDQAEAGGLPLFFSEEVGHLNWPSVRERMQLIERDKWSMSVYLSRVLTDEKGNQLDGTALWKEYVALLNDHQMDFAKKKVELSRITSKMNYFIYQIKRNENLVYNDKVGEIFFIENGAQYFDNEKLNRKKIQGEIGEFVDFI